MRKLTLTIMAVVSASLLLATNPADGGKAKGVQRMFIPRQTITISGTSKMLTARCLEVNRDTPEAKYGTSMQVVSGTIVVTRTDAKGTWAPVSLQTAISRGWLSMQGSGYYKKVGKSPWHDLKLVTNGEPDVKYTVEVKEPGLATYLPSTFQGREADERDLPVLLAGFQTRKEVLDRLHGRLKEAVEGLSLSVVAREFVELGFQLKLAKEPQFREYYRGLTAEKQQSLKTERIEKLELELSRLDFISRQELNADIADIVYWNTFYVDPALLDKLDAEYLAKPGVLAAFGYRVETVRHPEAFPKLEVKSHTAVLKASDGKQYRITGMDRDQAAALQAALPPAGDGLLFIVPGDGPATPLRVEGNVLLVPERASPVQRDQVRLILEALDRCPAAVRGNVLSLAARWREVTAVRVNHAITIFSAPRLEVRLQNGSYFLHVAGSAGKPPPPLNLTTFLGGSDPLPPEWQSFVDRGAWLFATPDLQPSEIREASRLCRQLGTRLDLRLQRITDGARSVERLASLPEPGQERWLVDESIGAVDPELPQILRDLIAAAYGPHAGNVTVLAGHATPEALREWIKRAESGQFAGRDVVVLACNVHPDMEQFTQAALRHGAASLVLPCDRIDGLAASLVVDTYIRMAQVREFDGPERLVAAVYQLALERLTTCMVPPTAAERVTALQQAFGPELASFFIERRLFSIGVDDARVQYVQAELRRGQELFDRTADTLPASPQRIVWSFGIIGRSKVML
jgi:hypothetical protein